MGLVLDLLVAILLLGLPLTALSWFLFVWLFNTGELDREGERKALSARLKATRKKIARAEKSNARYVYDKWMWFGSGFYGLAGLWTFAVIEITQLVEFIVDFPGWRYYAEQGFVAVVIDLVINQLGNMLQSLLWFSWWPADSILIWVLVAYLAYWAGVELARRQMVLPGGGSGWRKWLALITSRSR